MPAMFPWVIPCSESEANRLIRILMRNDKKCRPTPLPNGSSYAYTVNLENGLGGDLWLSSASADRIVLLCDVVLNRTTQYTVE